MPTYVATLSEIKGELGITDTDSDDYITRLIEAATDFLQRRTRRIFTTASATKRYDGQDKGYLVVDDFQSLTAVQLLNPDATAWKSFNVATELIGEPYNDVPKNRIVIVNNVSENPFRTIGNSPYIFPKGIANVSVTAVWGSWATIPAGLVDIGISLIKAKYNKRRTSGIASASIGGESISFVQSDLNDLDKGQIATLDEYKSFYVELWP